MRTKCPKKTIISSKQNYTTSCKNASCWLKRNDSANICSLLRAGNSTTDENSEDDDASKSRKDFKKLNCYEKARKLLSSRKNHNELRKSSPRFSTDYCSETLRKSCPKLGIGQSYKNGDNMGNEDYCQEASRKCSPRNGKCNSGRKIGIAENYCVNDCRGNSSPRKQTDQFSHDRFDNEDSDYDENPRRLLIFSKTEPPHKICKRGCLSCYCNQNPIQPLLKCDNEVDHCACRRGLHEKPPFCQNSEAHSVYLKCSPESRRRVFEKYTKRRGNYENYSANYFLELKRQMAKLEEEMGDDKDGNNFRGSENDFRNYFEGRRKEDGNNFRESENDLRDYFEGRRKGKNGGKESDNNFVGDSSKISCNGNERRSGKDYTCQHSKSSGLNITKDLIDFRDKNYFECHSHETQNNPKPHSCQHDFTINAKLQPVPKNPDAYGMSRCRICSKPSFESLAYSSKFKMTSKSSLSLCSVRLPTRNSSVSRFSEGSGKGFCSESVKSVPRLVYNLGDECYNIEISQEFYKDLENSLKVPAYQKPAPTNSVALRFQKGVC